MSARAVALVLLLASAATGCAGTAAMTPPPSITLTEADAGRAIEAARGQDVVVRLGSNPSTGYRWTLVGPASAALPSAGSSSKMLRRPARFPGRAHFLSFNFAKAMICRVVSSRP